MGTNDSTITIPAVAQATALNHCEFVGLPISACLLIRRGTNANITGSCKPFSTFLEGTTPSVVRLDSYGVASGSAFRDDGGMSDLAALPTEARNPLTEHIDELPTLEMLRLINAEDAKVAVAVAAELPQIALAVDAIADRFVRGGRLFYMGAGTSGRLGVLDASECPPTFGVDADLFQGIIAGGDGALRRSVEGAEDSFAQGALDLAARGFGKEDTLVGIAASGRTPYVLGAMDWATECGGATIGLSCVPGSPVARAAEIAITPNTGAEVVTGSTRMKAGTATKMVLNMLSTGVMIRRGMVLGNLMVNVQLTNAKLVDRGRRIVMAAIGCGEAEAEVLLNGAGSVLKAIQVSQDKI